MELNQIKNIIRSSKSPIYELSNIRSKVGTNKFDDIIKWIDGNSFVRNKIFHQYYPDKLDTFKTIPALTKVEPQKELAWAVSYIKPHIASIDKFLAKSREYQVNLFNGRYHICESLLNDIESNFGYSLWLIKNKISLKQLSSGLEEQKKYSYEIKDKFDNNGLASFITHYISIRNESSLGINRFAQLFNNHIDSFRLTNEYDAYLRYHIYPSSNINLAELVAILRYESAGAIIDIYEAIVFVMQFAIISDFTELSNIILKTAKYLYNRVDDTRILSVYNEVNNICEYFPCTQDDVSLYNSLLSNSFDSLPFSNVCLPDTDYTYSVIEQYATISAMYNIKVDFDNQIHSAYYSKLLSIMNKSADAVEQANDLVRLAMNNGTCSWTADIILFIDREMSSSNIPGDLKNALYAILESPSFYVGKYIAQSSKVADKYIVKSNSLFGDCLLNRTYNAVQKSDVGDISAIGLSIEYEAFFKLTISYILMDYDAAINHAKEILNLESIYLKNIAYKIMAHIYINQGDYIKASELIVDVILDNDALSYMMPLKNLVDSIGTDYKSMTGMLQLPIMYNLYSKYVDTQYDSQKTYSYEDFLLHYGLNKPSELESIANNFDAKLLLYYLKYVCVETTMDTSIAFQSSSEVLEERLAVCKLIIDLSEPSDSSLQAEIRDILRKLKIGKRIKEIEQSKIYVDLTGFKQTAIKSLHESYNRYLSIKSLHINSKQNEVLSKIKKIIADGDVSGLQVLILPNNEMTDMFESLMLSLRDEFVSSSEHGLDGYLSVRIRHGTLAGQLLSPLESHNLITKKQVNGSCNNYYWENKLAGAQDYTLCHVCTLLCEFTSKYNDIILSLKNDILQIKKTSTDNGIIDFTLNKVGINYLIEYANQDTSFSSFLDKTIDYFNAMLESNLTGVRKYIDTVLRNDIKSLVDELITKVELLPCNKELSDLTDSIKMTRTDIQSVLDRITEWFRLTNTNSEEPCTLEDAIDISRESLRMSKIDFSTNITSNDDIPIVHFKGHSLASLVDIFYIIFENIVRHSGVQYYPNATINMTYDNGILKLYITNDINSNVNVDIIRSKVSKIKTAINEDTYISSVRKEGGTGFHKILKILRHDITHKGQLDFGLQDDSIFFVQISLPVKELQC